MRMKTLIVATLDCCVLALVVVRSNIETISRNFPRNAGSRVVDASMAMFLWNERSSNDVVLGSFRGLAVLVVGRGVDSCRS